MHFKNLNAEIYQNEMDQSKSMLKRGFSPSHKVAVTMKITWGSLALSPEIQIQQGWGGAQESACPLSSPGGSQTGSLNQIWKELDIRLILFSTDSGQINNVLSLPILSPEKQGHL